MAKTKTKTKRMYRTVYFRSGVPDIVTEEMKIRHETKFGKMVNDIIVEWHDLKKGGT
jgi:hypothetical protein